jgi:hypothetical protein
MERRSPSLMTRGRKGRYVRLMRDPGESPMRKVWFTHNKVSS